MDPLDEFEFKPLTDGLGFHKKAVRLSEQVKSSRLVEDQVGKLIPTPPPMNSFPEPLSPAVKTSVQSFEDLLKNLEPKPKVRDSQLSEEVRITDTLPRPERRPVYSAREMGPPISIPIPGTDAYIPQSKPRISDELKSEPAIGTRRGGHDAGKRQLVTAPVCFRSAILDGMVVIAVSLIFMVSLMLVAKVNLLNAITNAQTDLMAQMSAVTLSVAVLLMYVVVSRSFFGRTLGEWTFDFQMGQDQEHNESLYPLKVVWRSLLVVLTGIVVLPLLSWIANKDLLASLTGLQLYQAKES